MMKQNHIKYSVKIREVGKKGGKKKCRINEANIKQLQTW